MRFAVHGRKGYGEDLVADIIADVKDPAAPIFQARRHDERPHHERGPLARPRQVADGGAASIDHYPLHAGAMEIKLSQCPPPLEKRHASSMDSSANAGGKFRSIPYGDLRRARPILFRWHRVRVV